MFLLILTPAGSGRNHGFREQIVLDEDDCMVSIARYFLIYATGVLW